MKESNVDMMMTMKTKMTADTIVVITVIERVIKTNTFLLRLIKTVKTINNPSEEITIKNKSIIQKRMINLNKIKIHKSMQYSRKNHK